jgi:trans-2,3-dihydro-3-hydroxyanthranilate isomerase
VRYAFRLVDVFTDRPFAGNQLAVVLDAEGLDAARMQAIAREFNFSETTFVTPSAAAGCDWRVRIFTPTVELPMAGHPTIGTGVVLEALGRARERTVLELGVGPVPVRVRPGWAEMDQRPPTFGPEHPDPAALALAISAEPEDITATGLPVQAVGTGLAHLMVPVRSLDAIRRLRPRPELLGAAMAGFEELAVYAFTREVEMAGSDAHCRMFAPHLGVLEDPATGSAAGPLACYLAAHAAPTAAGPLRWRFEQGFEMGRQSLLEASVERDGGGVTAVRVGGSACIVGEGWLTAAD